MNIVKRIKKAFSGDEREPIQTELNHLVDSNEMVRGMQYYVSLQPL